MPYIDVQNVSFYYDNNPVLEEVSYSVNWGICNIDWRKRCSKVNANQNNARYFET